MWWLDYINTSHPGFIGGNKGVEIALNQQRIAKTPKVSIINLSILFDVYNVVL